MFEHPYILAMAAVLTVPFVMPLIRLFFDGPTQMAEDLGVTSNENRWTVLLGLLNLDSVIWRRQPGILLNVIWFTVALVALVALAYHALLWVLPLFGLTLASAP